MVEEATRESSLVLADHKDTVPISFAGLLKNGVVEAGGKIIGRVDDLIVELRPNDFGRLTVVVVRDGPSKTYVLSENILQLATGIIRLRQDERGFRPSPLNDGEVSLKSDILCRRVVDVVRSTLVRVYDVRLAAVDGGWAAVGLDVHRGRWFGLGSHASHAARDWRNFLPLPSLSGPPLSRSAPNWIGRLKPHQIADLIEEATAEEQDQLLEQVHSDPELEADVFEELEDQSQAQLFRSLDDSEVAEVLSRMRADDAADAVMELVQDRRQRVLDLLPEAGRTKILTLLGYNEATAGGLMGTEFIALSEQSTIADALQHIREATTDQPEALITIHSIDNDGKLAGTLGLVRALQLPPSLSLAAAADPNIVSAAPGDEISKVVTRMADFNLLSLPVVDGEGKLIGVVTVDDALEAALPKHWIGR